MVVQNPLRVVEACYVPIAHATYEHADWSQNLTAAPRYAHQAPYHTCVTSVTSLSCPPPFMAARDLHVTSAPDLCCALLCAGGMRVVVQNPFPDLERVCISGHHGRSRFVAYCTREPAHTRTRSTRSLRTALPLTPPSPIRISKGCLLTPPAIRTRRRIARASWQASCTERCTRQPSPTTQPTPS